MLFVLLGLIVNCAEFQGKDEDNNEELQAILLALSNNAVCPTSAVSAAPTNGTRFDFTQCSGPASAALKLAGFTANEVQLIGGLVGSGNNSTIITDASRLSGSATEKKATIQITYVMNASDSTIDVIMPSNTSLSGATFQITTTELKKKLLNGTSALAKPGLWASSQGTEKTLCLEIHNENGAHMFGWNGPCASVNRGTYEFDEESVTGFDFSGDRIALRINKATVRSINIYNANIGTAGNIR